MGEFLSGPGAEAVAALQGPLQFRVLMQVFIAASFGARDGMHDAHRGLPPLWTGRRGDPAMHRVLVVETRESLAKVILLVLGTDVMFQAIILGFGAPFDALAIAAVVAVPLYLTLRSLVRWFVLKHGAPS